MTENRLDPKKVERLFDLHEKVGRALEKWHPDTVEGDRERAAQIMEATTALMLEVTGVVQAFALQQG